MTLMVHIYSNANSKGLKISKYQYIIGEAYIQFKDFHTCG